MSLLEEIGAILGFVAFGGFAVLAFLTFQQARHLRRLREWAGRQPERAAAEEERVAELATEAGLAGGASQASEPQGPSRKDRVRGELAFRMEELDRRSPVDPRLLLAGLVAIVVAVGIVTSGFGLLGDEEPTTTTTTEAEGTNTATAIEVAVLNGTAPAEGGAAVEGVADRASQHVGDVEGFKVGEVGDAVPPSFPASVVMFEEGFKKNAKELASGLETPLAGEPEIELVTSEVQSVSGAAKLTLIIGLDDSGI